MCAEKYKSTEDKNRWQYVTYGSLADTLRNIAAKIPSSLCSQILREQADYYDPPKPALDNFDIWIHPDGMAKGLSNCETIGWNRYRAYRR